MAGLLVLNGGDEFKTGNEPQDRELVAWAGAGAAFVLPTAAARTGPDEAAAHARAWFGKLGLELQVLPVLTPTHARSPELAQQARAGGFFYLVGGDPGHVARVLRGSPVWEAVVEAWRGGAALAGSSAGAMALCEWTLVRERWPDRTQRRYQDALGLLPGTVVLPHYDTFGHRWIESALAGAPRAGLRLLGPDERTAAVWRDGVWRCVGAGRVTVGGEEGMRVFETGETVEGLVSDL